MEREKEFTERSLTYYRTRLLCPPHGLRLVVRVKEGIATLKCGCERGANILPLMPGRVSVEQLASRSEEIKQIAGKFFPSVSPVRDWRLELAAHD